MEYKLGSVILFPIEHHCSTPLCRTRKTNVSRIIFHLEMEMKLKMDQSKAFWESLPGKQSFFLCVHVCGGERGEQCIMGVKCLAF